MSENDSRLHLDLDDLKRVRDELRVKANLGKLEAEDAWHELEARWEDLEAKMGQIGRESGEAVGEIRTAARLLVDELGDAYKDIRRRILS